MAAKFQVVFGKISTLICLFVSFALFRRPLSIIITYILYINSSYTIKCAYSLFFWLAWQNKLFRWKHGTQTSSFRIEMSPQKSKTGTKYLLQTMKWYEPIQAKSHKKYHIHTQITESEHHKNLLNLCYALTHKFSQWIRFRSFFFPSFSFVCVCVCVCKFWFCFRHLSSQRVKNYQQ